MSSSRILLANYLQGQNPFLKNYIKNESCLVNVAGITPTDTTVTRNTTTPLTAVSDCQFTMNSTNDDVQWQVNALDRALYGQNCEVRLSYKTTVGSGNTLQMRLKNLSATVASVNLPTASNGLATINFPCGDGSESYFVQVLQTAGSSSQDINVANVYLGAATNVGNVSQAEVYGTAVWTGATNCSWGTTSASFTNLSADTDCNNPTVTGSISAPGTKIPGVTATNILPGKYLVQVNAQGASLGGGQYGFRLSDGTTNGAATGGFISNQVPFSISAVFEYTSIQSSVTWQIQAVSDGSNTAQVRVSSAEVGMVFSVTRFPTSSEIAYRPEQVFQGGSVKYAGATNCVWTSTSSSYANFSADTDCSTGSATGAVTAPGTKIPGLVVSKLPAGRYLMMATGGFVRGSASGNNVNFRFSDGTNTTAGQRLYTATSGEIKVPVISGILETSSEQTNVTIQVQALDDGGSSVQIHANDSNTDFQISIIPLSINLPVPILIGSVTSNSTGAERIERLRVDTSCTSSPCTITSQSGSWVSSITRNSIGNYTINVASGIFSESPVCTANQLTTVPAPSIIVMQATSPTAVATLSYDHTGNAIDNGFNVICMGQRA